MIALEVDRRGFAACPPQSEPIAEFAETISQLRIAFYRDARAEEEPSQRLLPVDFSTRSAFRIECELPGALVFGSRVRLIHDTSDCKLVASELEDPGVVLADPTLKSKARKKGPKLADHVRSISATHIEDPKLKKFVAEAVTRSGSDGMINGGSRRNSRDIGEAKMRCTYLLPSSKKCKNNEDIWIISSRYKLRSEGESVYSVMKLIFL